MKRTRNRQEKKLLKFTILELLIVISIMIILTSILFPALNSARKKGQSITCISHLKQLGTTCLVYEQEHGGGVEAVTSASAGYIRWQSVLMLLYVYPPQAKSSRVLNVQVRHLLKWKDDKDYDAAAQVKAYGIFECPGQVSNNYTRGFQEANHYGLNRYVGENLPSSSSAVSYHSTLCYRRIKRPSQRMLLTDSRGSGQDAYSPKAVSGLDFRHLARGNFAFLDGHVESRGLNTVPPPVWGNTGRAYFWGQYPYPGNE